MTALSRLFPLLAPRWPAAALTAVALAATRCAALAAALAAALLAALVATPASTLTSAVLTSTLAAAALASALTAAALASTFGILDLRQLRSLRRLEMRRDGDVSSLGEAIAQATNSRLMLGGKQRSTSSMLVDRAWDQAEARRASSGRSELIRRRARSSADRFGEDGERPRQCLLLRDQAVCGVTACLRTPRL